MTAGWNEARVRAPDGDQDQQHAGDGQAARGRCLGVDHLVVDVVREGVGDREQEAVRRAERRGQTAGRDQPGDHVGQPRDLGRRQNDGVGMNHELRQLQDAVAVAVDRHARCARTWRWSRPHPRRRRS